MHIVYLLRSWKNPERVYVGLCGPLIVISDSYACSESNPHTERSTPRVAQAYRNRDSSNTPPPAGAQLSLKPLLNPPLPSCPAPTQLLASPARTSLYAQALHVGEGKG
jgi:hypothetical protein